MILVETGCDTSGLGREGWAGERDGYENERSVTTSFLVAHQRTLHVYIMCRARTCSKPENSSCVDHV